MASPSTSSHRLLHSELTKELVTAGSRAEMARNLTSDDYRTVNSFHGIPTSTPNPKRTLIAVPKDGDTPGNRSSSSSNGRPKRKKDKLPSHPTTFQDNLHSKDDPIVRPFTSNGTARRASSSSRSVAQPTPSPNSQARPHPTTSSSAIYVDIPTSSKPDKGKGRAQNVSPRTTRSKSLRKASAQTETIDLASDDDDDDDDDDAPQFVTESSSSSRASRLASKEAITNPALLAKAKRLRHRAASSPTSSMLSPAVPDAFYARPETYRSQPANRPHPLFKHGRPDGPIQLEEPRPRRPSGSTPVVHVRESPDPEPDLEIIPPYRLNRGSSGQQRSKMVDRMKPKARSPNQADSLARPSSSSAVTAVSPSRSPARSPHSKPSHPELSPSPQDQDVNGSSKGRKRLRIDAGASPSQEKRAHDEKIKFPYELRLQAVVISDTWRSRDPERPLLLLNTQALFFGMHPGNTIRIRYADIRQIVASQLDVEDCGILCLTLTPNSESAATVQKVFSEYDPRASGEASQIQLIAHESSQLDLIKHKRAIDVVIKACCELSSESVKTLWLDEHSTKSKIISVEHVKRLRWPDPSNTLGQTQQVPPVQPRAKRTLIFPGAGRMPNNEVRESTRAITTYKTTAPRKKTFNIQPDSPNSSANMPVDVDMQDARSRSKSPILAPLTIPKAKPASVPAPKVEVRRPRVSSDGIILRYPYEGTGSMSLRESDFDKLLDGGLLNDVVIEFGIKFILDEIRAKDPDLADSIYVFNTFFFPILMSDSVENSYAKLRRWTAKDDLFSKKYIIIPVNENYHWYLALIVNPGFILTEHSKDTSSEQDKEEVAMALTMPWEDSKRQPSSHKGSAATESKEAAPEARQTATDFGSQEPETPPLPPLQLPLQSFGNIQASLPTPIDVDKDSQDETSTKKPTATATDPDQLIIITLDSLAQRHVKLGNKMFEYLWREAWDKKKSTILKQPKEPVDDKGKQTKSNEDAKEANPPERSDEIADAHAGESEKEAAKAQAKETTPKDTTDEVVEEPAAPEEGVRLVQVQDTRRPAAPANTTSAEAEAWAKSLSKAVYISAQVPEQPNFCDCGIYLLHYIDRFFREPEKLLKLMVDAKDRLSSANKAGPSIRQQVRKGIEESVEAYWQAGEVSSKRAYWRSKLVELSEGWEEYKKRKEENAAKSEQEQTKPEKDDKEPEVAALQQKPAPSPPRKDDGDVPMPDADSGVLTEEAKSLQQDEKPAEVDMVDSLGMTAVSLDDIERSVNDCVRGKDPAASLAVDSILAQAMTMQHGPLSQQHIQQLQMEDREQTDQPETDPGWRSNLRDTGAPSSAVPSVADPGSPALAAAAAAAAAGVEAPPEPLVLDKKEAQEPVRASPTLSASSVTSQQPREQRHEQSQQQQEGSRTTPSAFGASMLATALQSSSSETRPSLSFSSSKNLALDAVRDDEDVSMDGEVSKASSQMAPESISSSSSSSSDDDT